MIALWFVIIIIVCYFIGSVNFARILAWKRHNQDITTKGSHNPGTMNMLRVYGIKIAIATMLLEFLKGGVPALLAGLIMNHYYPGIFYVAFLTAGLSAVVGQIFPAIYNFKGGKCLATCAGVFLFSPLWWLGLIFFVLGCIVLYITDYASVATLSFVCEMTIATTIYLALFDRVAPYWWIAIILVWVMFALIFFAHRGNLVRLAHKRENKANFSKSLQKLFNKKSDITIIEKEQEQEKPEKEIIIEDEEKDNN